MDTEQVLDEFWAGRLKELTESRSWKALMQTGFDDQHGVGKQNEATMYEMAEALVAKECERHGENMVSLAILRGERRCQYIVDIRAELAMRVRERKPEISASQIATFLNRDRTTIIHYFRKGVAIGRLRREQISG